MSCPPLPIHSAYFEVLSIHTSPTRPESHFHRVGICFSDKNPTADNSLRSQLKKKRGRSITSKSVWSVASRRRLRNVTLSPARTEWPAWEGSPRPPQLTLRALKWIISHSAGGAAGGEAGRGDFYLGFPCRENKLWMWQRGPEATKGNESLQAARRGPKWRVINRQMALIRLIVGGVGAPSSSICSDKARSGDPLETHDH